MGGEGAPRRIIAGETEAVREVAETPQKLTQPIREL